MHCDIKPENIMLKEEHKTGIKVIDMGSGCFEGKQLYTYIQSRFYRAPEIVLGVRYTTAIDMWSFGCVLAELQKGYPIFPGKDENEQMLLYLELLGNPPKHLLDQAQRRKKFFDSNYECKLIQTKNNKKRTFENTLKTKDELFIDLIKKCLEWDPEKRIKPQEALTHSWILESLPTSLRTRHKQEVIG